MNLICAVSVLRQLRARTVRKADVVLEGRVPFLQDDLPSATRRKHAPHLLGRSAGLCGDQLLEVADRVLRTALDSN